MNIVFVGGGTLGPVTPLLAAARRLKRLKPEVKLFWIGTPSGPERPLVEAQGIPFRSLPVVKWPRYPSLRWFTFPFDWARVRALAKRAVAEINPDAVVTAGGFTAVPVFFEAAKRGIPCFAHQLDREPGMANRRIAKLCGSMTTSFEYERPPFGEWVHDERIATPSRFASAEAMSRDEGCKTFGLDPHRPVVLIFGGGTGAQALNDMMSETRDAWLKMAQVIHVTGIGKSTKGTASAGYAVKSFLDKDMLAAYAAADVVICRAGMGAFAEIAALKKAAILVPMPHSHQEANARAFEDRGAAVVVRQDTQAFSENLLSAARHLLENAAERQAIGERAHAFLPTDDGTEFAKRISASMAIRQRMERRATK